jgi:hypothetical protein
MKTSHQNNGDSMRAHYDFSKGVRGKYAARYAAGCNIVLLEPDLVKVFPDSKAVNEALRSLVEEKSKRHKKAS